MLKISGKLVPYIHQIYIPSPWNYVEQLIAFRPGLLDGKVFLEKINFVNTLWKSANTCIVMFVKKIKQL